MQENLPSVQDDKIIVNPYFVSILGASVQEGRIIRLPR